MPCVIIIPEKLSFQFSSIDLIILFQSFGRAFSLWMLIGWVILKSIFLLILFERRDFNKLFLFDTLTIFFFFSLPIVPPVNISYILVILFLLINYII